MHSSGRANRGLAGMGVLALMMLILCAGEVDGSNCNVTSTGRVPINDLGAGLYLGQYAGGLYPGASNVVPATHAEEGHARAQAIEPLNALGQPDANGKYVLLSIGMSNTTQEY